MWHLFHDYVHVLSCHDIFGVLLSQGQLAQHGHLFHDYVHVLSCHDIFGVPLSQGQLAQHGAPVS